MTDIVKELRQGSLSNDDYRWKAADEIERLREEARTDRGFYGGSLIRLEMENAKLRAALEEIRDAGPMTLDDQRWRIALDALGGE